MAKYILGFLYNAFTAKYCYYIVGRPIVNCNVTYKRDKKIMISYS